MSILSSASLAYRGGAMLNFAGTEFYEVRRFNALLKAAQSFVPPLGTRQSPP